MGICADELRHCVIRPTLILLDESKQTQLAAENLLLGTAAHESGLGFRLKPENGRGIGIYQISPQLHTNVWDKYLINYPELASTIRGIASQHRFLKSPHNELCTNLSYATAIAWTVYKRHEKPLPPADDTLALGKYWARYYHQRSMDCAKEFAESYEKFVIAAPGNSDGKSLAA